MTCKDCIHHCICNEHERVMLTIDNLYELMYQEGVDMSCKHFRNKADFVEVVRCKDCQYFTEGMAVGMCKRIEDKPIIPCRFDHFCSYGERRKDAD